MRARIVGPILALVVAVLGVFTCGAMIFGLGWTNWVRLIVWMAIGLVIYFTYSRKRSKLMLSGEAE